MTNPPSPECLRKARTFFLSDEGKEFLEYMRGQRPFIVTSPEVHTFAFSAGRPAGYDLFFQYIEDAVNPEKPERAPRTDSIHT